MRLSNYLAGRWQDGAGAGIALRDPVDGAVIAEVSSDGLDLGAALEFARSAGGTALRAQGYAARARMLGAIADLLTRNKDVYNEISLRNSGATPGDAAFDIDGAIFTLKSYARAGAPLGDGRWLKDGAAIALTRNDAFAGQHFLAPLTGVAVFVNAFNFPAWGLWEKAAPALLSGMPVLVKPATPTAWLTQRMVADVVEAGLLPAGALSVVCGGARDLLDHLRETDVLSFTGSAETARRLRTHPAVIGHAVRINVEADSVNSAIVGPDAQPGSAEFDLAVREIVREMTIKAGQKCTAIRRVFAPSAQARALADAVAAQLATIPVGNPRNAQVRMGPLVNRAQQAAARAGIALLRQDAQPVYGDDPAFVPIDADPQLASFVQPTLLICTDGAAAHHVHDVEVFGPVATIVPYADPHDAIQLVRRGRGSLVASIYSSDTGFCDAVVAGIADLHGRIMIVDAQVGTQHTGHGNVMPTCLHGGPGRAGGGEELGGLRALALYHRRFVAQATPARLAALGTGAGDAALMMA